MLNLISRLIHLVFGSNRLRPYERACIDAWSSKLSEGSQQRLASQLEKFDLVQRQAGGTKSVFYSIRDPQYKTWGEDILFPNRDEEKKIFTGALVGVIGDIAETVRFSIYLNRGRLSSIEFISEPGMLASLTKGLTVSGQLVDML